jgi:dihydrolipoamide dehydrogenase
MTHPSYDLIVIGGGPAGYVAAERAAAAGLRVLLAEKDQLGGVCLNCGCIPSKALLHAAKTYYQATHGETYGVIAGSGMRFDFARARDHQRQVMDTLRKGVTGLMKKHKVDVVRGEAVLRSAHTVAVADATYTAANILIATGSSPARPPIPGHDLPHVVDSTGLLNLATLPASLAIVGGGVIGCEFACAFASVGVPVTVIEMLPEICPALDPDVAALLRTELAHKGITFHTGARVEAITPDAVRITLNGEPRDLPAACVLLATGRRPNVSGLGLDAAGVDADHKGIRIDERCATNVPGIWAAGDVTGRTWLAHAASRMAEVIVHNLTGRPDRMRFDTIAGVVYTSPEAAGVGLTEAQAAARSIPVRIGKLPMAVSGRYLAENAGARGLVKVLLHADTGALLGAHLLGGACSEIIASAAHLIELECRAREIEDLVFPHPTVSETLREAVLAAK